MTNCNYIDNYISIIKDGTVCKEQKLLAEYIKKAFEKETLTIDEEQATKYLNLQKYFPYKLFDWEIFLFVLHNCVYKKNGQLRWPELFIMVGRGAGKNGYLAFEDFALLTPINGIKNYDIDIFATSEDQAKTTFNDIYEVLEDHPQKLSKHFYWNKELIRNIQTNSTLKFRTANPKTKDGGRPGKVDFDEYHAYENYKMITVARTGLGKKAFPRSTIITTNGDVRDGPLDHTIDRSENILKGTIPDNGLLPFICRIDDKSEVDEVDAWNKANPSLIYFPTLQEEMKREYEDYKIDRIGNNSFMTKRMNRSEGNAEFEVTSWENILAACGDVPDLTGKSCVGGIDYAKTSDFVVAGLLFEVSEMWYWMTHTWVCRYNKTSLSRIRFPLEDAAQKGLLTFVDEVEIPPEAPAGWLQDMKEKYNIAGVAIDSYRYQLMKKALSDVGFDAEKNACNNIKLVRPSDIMQMTPVISSKFAKHEIAWGDNALMRWYTNNTKQIIDSKGNISYGKIEPKARKTDGFMAMVAASTKLNDIEGWNDTNTQAFPEVIIF